MKRLSVILALILATSICASAQDADWIDVTALHAAATGNTNTERALKQYLLISDDAVDSNRETLDQFQTFLEEYNQMEINTKLPEVQKEMMDAIAQMEQTIKEHPELAAAVKDQLEEAKKEVKAQSALTDPSVKSFSCNTAELLKKLKAIAINRKAYTGYEDIGNDLYAVTEAPRFGQVQEQAFTKIEVADNDQYTWGVINKQGKTIIPQKYCLLISYFIRPSHDFIMFAEKGKDGKDHYGAFFYDGRIRIPFVFDDVKAINTNDNYIMGIQGGKYGTTDLDGKVIVPFEYADMKLCGIAWPVSKDGKNYGLVSTNGKKSVPFKYKDFLFAENGLIYMERFDGKIDVFDENLTLVRTEERD